MLICLTFDSVDNFQYLFLRLFLTLCVVVYIMRRPWHMSHSHCSFNYNVWWLSHVRKYKCCSFLVQKVRIDPNFSDGEKDKVKIKSIYSRIHINLLNDSHRFLSQSLTNCQAIL